MSPTTIVRPPRAPSLDVLLSLPPAQYTRLCCFCIPARVALFITAAMLIILSTSFVTVGWAIVNKLSMSARIRYQSSSHLPFFLKNPDDYVTDLQRLSIVFHIFIYIVLAAFCIFGFVRSHPSPSRPPLTLLNLKAYSPRSAKTPNFPVYSPPSSSDNSSLGGDQALCPYTSSFPPLRPFTTSGLAQA